MILCYCYINEASRCALRRSHGGIKKKNMINGDRRGIKNENEMGALLEHLGIVYSMWDEVLNVTAF